MNDSLFNKVEKKTNIKKETILSLANKLQKGNMKDKNVLTEVIDELSVLTGKSISDEKKEKIINTIVNNQVPKDIDSKF